MRASQVFRVLVLSATAAILCQANASAAFEPRLKPVRPNASAIVSDADLGRLRDGLEAAERGDWTRVRSLESTITDPTAAHILNWRRAASDPSMSFSSLDRALVELADWPRLNDIRSEAEAKIDAAGLTPREIVSWFEARDPASGQGEIAFVDALMAVGRRDEATERLRRTWRERLLPLDVQSRTLSRYGNLLTQADHVARVDYLLWRDQRTAASRLFAQLPSDQRRLAEARISLASRSRGVDAAVDRVPQSLQSDAGLLFERARWRRRAGLTDNAAPLVRQIGADDALGVGRGRIWDERRVHIARALKRGDYRDAYDIAASHGLSEGVDFADAEWLAGWLALRRLGDPKRAEAHFARLEANVSTPISQSRGLYWLAEAQEEAGDVADAAATYRQAAAMTTAYYGQLAATRLDQEARRATLPQPIAPGEAERAEFAARDLVRAIMLFAELDELSLFREFAYHLDDRLETPAEYALLSELANGYGQPAIGVRAAKTGLAKGVIESGAAYPVRETPPLSYAPIRPEDALVLALVRQESEFDPRATSHVGARGLMQLMPATARATARSIGVSYRTNWLIDDADYNMRLGSSHLADLLEEFDGSYVLAAAAYNAGAHRARQWIAEYGDPRLPGVDPVDWVESIPFSETRNYVQRVMENVQVYRARLEGGETEIALDADLKRGGMNY